MLRSIARYIVLAGSVALTTGALADGAPRRAAPKAAAPVAAAPAFSWTGFYVGANLGAARIDDGAVTATPADPNTQLVLTLFCDIGLLCSTNRGPADSTGVIGGVQFGYNAQMGAVVIGFEMDLQGSTANASRGVSQNFGGGVFFNGAANTSLEWLSTVRGRLGFLLNPTTLVYATGGFAFGDVQRSYGFNLSNVVVMNGRQVSTDTGWTVGGGVEWSLGGGLTLGAEYLYVNLDGGDRYQATSVANTCGNPCAVNVNSSDLDLHIARLKVNYKF